MLNKDERIRLLEEELAKMRLLEEGMVPFEEITAEARANYEQLAGLGFAFTLQTDFQKKDTTSTFRTDTIPVFVLRWNEGLSTEVRQENMRKLTQWLQLRLKNEKIQVREAGS